jgi:DNA-binding MarR family transcriptional regulator
MAGEDLRRQIGLVIHEVARLRRVVVNRRLRPIGITRSQAYLLAFLIERDGMTQAALADDLEVTRVAIGSLLSRMEANGLVRRRDDDIDARLKRVYLSKAGQKVGAKIIKAVDLLNEELLGHCGSESLQTTVDTLLSLKANLLQMIVEDDGKGTTVTYKRAKKK